MASEINSPILSVRNIKVIEATGSIDLSLDQRFPDVVEVANIDLLTDLDVNFFSTSYELVQDLVPTNNFLARKIKRYVDILARIHTRYVEEVNTNTEMQKKIGEAEARLQLALETSSDSNEVMAHMKESLAKAWRTADAAQRREVKMQLSQENYSNIDISKRTGDPQNPAQMRIRGIVFRERDRLARELKEYQKRLETNRIYAQSLEVLVLDLRNTIAKHQVRVKSLEGELFRQENKFRITTEGLEAKIIHYRKESESVSQINQELRLIEKKYRETLTINENLRQQLDRYSHDNIILQKTNHQLEEDKSAANIKIRNMEHKVTVLRRERDDTDAKYRAIERGTKKISELNALLNRRFLLLSKKNTLLSELQLVKTNELDAVERKLALNIRKLDETTRQKLDVERGREKLRVEIVSLNDGISSLKHDIAGQRKRMHDMQLDLDRSHVEMDQMEAKLHKNNREKNELLAETNTLNKTIENIDNELEKKIERITILEECLQQKTKDYQNSKKQLEILLTDNKMLQKNFEACGRDRQSIQNINTKLTFQITQLCNQVAMNEKDIITHKNQIDQLESSLKLKQNEIHSKDQMVQSLRAELFDNRMRNGQLQHTIEEDEKRFKHMSYNLDEVRKEKSLEGQQLVRRNGELRLQREKLAMMQLALDRGTIQYNQRVEDIRLLKTEIHNVQQSNECLQRGISSTANMRLEIVRLERQLVRERLQVTAFTEETKRPYRIHRWRVVRGNDPHKFELIRKVQLLLKRNLRHSAQRANLEQKLQDLQQLYDTLKRQVQSLPNANCKQQLVMQQRKYQQQQRKLRAIKAELAMNEVDLKSKDCTIEQLKHSIPHVIPPTSSKSSCTNRSKYDEQVFQMSSQVMIRQTDNESSSF